MPTTALRISAWLQLTYPCVAFVNTRLKPPKKRARMPCECFRGLSRSAESAGERVSALKAEMSTEIAIVTAN